MKYCKKCGCDTERYARGGCKPCTRSSTSKWKKEHPKENVASGTKWAKKYPEYAAAIKAKWAAANPDRIRAANKRWLESNADSMRAYSHNRRARKSQNGGVLSNGLADKLFHLQCGKCACCGLPLGSDYHMDHIMPLALGGANTDDNIQLLRAKCNLQKHAKHPVDFMQSKGLLL